jgi:hypothetical protein
MNHFIEKMIIYPDGGGHIILNYKKISREYSFSRGGSNTETNASPMARHCAADIDDSRRDRIRPQRFCDCQFRSLTFC